jgi:GDP-4-dehydro-6-deoxy-D-mannose reductase
VINIASGRTVKIGAILEILLGSSSAAIAVRQDPARLRPVEIARAAGDITRATVLLGWQPRVELEDTLRSVLDSARKASTSFSEEKEAKRLL